MTREQLTGAVAALEEIEQLRNIRTFPLDCIIYLRCKYRAQLAELGPEPAQPWTPRERRLYAALERLTTKLDEVHKSREYAAVWYLAHLHDGAYCGPTYTKELEDAVAAIADTPPPDPRDEALEAAEKALGLIAKASYESYARQKAIDALAAIARAKGGNRE